MGFGPKQKNRRSSRRKFGRDRRRALPPVAPPSSVLAIGRGRIGIIVTVVAWFSFVVPTIWREITNPTGWSFGSFVEASAYVTLTSFLALSATAYLLARHGSMVRSRLHRRAPRGLIDEGMRSRADRSLTTLIPSYKEEARVIRQTLLSAALQEYPSNRIVLLIDDPQKPDSEEANRLLEEARALPGEIADLLAEPAQRFTAALKKFRSSGKCNKNSIIRCANLYREAGQYLEDMRRDFEVVDHTDRFCRDEVLGALQQDLDDAAASLETAGQSGHTLSKAVMIQFHQRLAWIFSCELTSFERKRFVNLSHEVNKAMNLNSYIGLMGGSFKIEQGRAHTALAECDPDQADLIVPDTDYVLTLDADSVLLPEYCLRLTHRLEQPAFADVAVIQTPYSSYPGSNSRIERISAATTDVQHILHQGMTYYEATFWVGANAILRREALEDIAEIDYSGPWPVKRYISDRTVIEDTESSIDLVSHGWRLHNYQERLSYSATPPDFGSLCVQRERWANGGLLIMPKLAQLVRRGADPIGLLLRLNYTSSIAWSSIGLLLLLVWPFDDRLLSPLVVAMAIPYFMAMSSDLKRSGYKRTDVVRVYAFNLLMLPVNLVGTVKSMYQAVSGRKYAFVRTPKVKHRTTAPFGYVAFPYLLIAAAGYTTYHDIQNQFWEHAIFSGLNTILAFYGLVVFIGIRNSFVDMAIRSFESLRRDIDTREAEVHTSDWEDQLFYGNDGVDEGNQLRMPARLARAQPGHFTPPEEVGEEPSTEPSRSPERVAARRSGSASGFSAPASLSEMLPSDVLSDDELHEALRATRVLLAAIEEKIVADENDGELPNGQERSSRGEDYRSNNRKRSLR